jgi:hypothetical protein
VSSQGSWTIGERPEEAAFAELARVSPSSAGFFLNAEGLVVVVVARPEEDGLARAGAAALIAAGRVHDARAKNGGVVIQRGQYAFAQLAQWRDAVFDNLLGGVEGLEVVSKLP